MCSQWLLSFVNFCVEFQFNGQKFFTVIAPTFKKILPEFKNKILKSHL